MTTTPDASPPATRQAAVPAADLAGLATVAALTFLAARAVPGGFVVALVGGVPLARAADRHGPRAGFATATASLVETIAVMGPARLIVPLPHVLTAPLLGALHRRRAPFMSLAAVGAVVRLVLYLASFAIYVFVVVGAGAFLGTYTQFRGFAGWLPAGTAGAVISVVVFNGLWSVIGGAVQAWVVRRGLTRWPLPRPPVEALAEFSEPAPGAGLDGRVVLAAGLVAFVATIVTTRPLVLATVTVWLVVAWVVSRAAPRALLSGLGIAAPLAVSIAGFGFVGGLTGSVVLIRVIRVALLVFVAVWLRAAAGPSGLRDASMGLVARFQGAPTLALTSRVLGESAGAGDFTGAARRLAHRLGAARRRPLPVLDATLGWIADESLQACVTDVPPAPHRWNWRESATVVLAVALAVAVPIAWVAGG